ncbi:MAG: hypothetical protein AVDCRST_MAG59-3267, partial [uncultured Thermomicrobiales bacterium]
RGVRVGRGAAVREAAAGGDPGAVAAVQRGDRVPAAGGADRPPAGAGDHVRAAGARTAGDPGARRGSGCVQGRGDKAHDRV